MTLLMHALYPGDDVTVLVLNLLIQITAVILLTTFVARKFLRRSAAAAHAAWLTCLAFVAACPFIMFAGNRAGISVVSLPLAARTHPTTRAEVSAAPLPVSAATVTASLPTELRPSVWDDEPPHASLTAESSISRQPSR